MAYFLTYISYIYFVLANGQCMNVKKQDKTRKHSAVMTQTRLYSVTDGDEHLFLGLTSVVATRVQCIHVTFGHLVDMLQSTSTDYMFV